MQFYTSKKHHIKDIFLHNDNWKSFIIKHGKKLRKPIIDNVAKILLCNSLAMGFKYYQCPTCDFSKKVFFTCKSKSCSCCGKKATDKWIHKNYSILPKTKWQNITFTLPSELWDLFWCNRELMTELPKFAVACIKGIAAKKGVTPGIFLAIHTFGRELLRNYHLHVATTCGGLSKDLKKWVNVYFNHQLLKTKWKLHVLKLLRQKYAAGELHFPKSLEYLNEPSAFNAWANVLYKKKWVVHLAKPTTDHMRNIAYLGKYLKRPPLSEANIINHDGVNVTLRHLDHYTKSYKMIKFPVFEFISRFIMHIPDKYFRSIRYYGWLANRVRAKMLTIVYKLLQQSKEAETNKLSWLKMTIKEFFYNPLKCYKCNQYLCLIGATYTKNLKKFINNHYLLIDANLEKSLVTIA